MDITSVSDIMKKIGPTSNGWRVLEGKYSLQIHSDRHWLANIKCERCPAWENDIAELIAMAPLLARRVIAAEKLASLLGVVIKDLVQRDLPSTREANELYDALTAYREASK